MYRSTLPAHRLPSPSAVDGSLAGGSFAPGSAQVSQWAAHRAALAAAVAENPTPRRRRRTRAVRAAVAQTA